MSYLKLINMDDKFNSLTFVPFIANEMSLESDEDKRNFNGLIYTHYDGESLSLTPSCECGQLQAEYLVGEICPTCGTACTHKYSGSTESLIWINCPKQIKAFMLPIVWTMLTNSFRAGKFDTILFLTDPLYRPLGKVPDNVLRVRQHFGDNFKRSYNFFVENFYEILEILSTNAKGRLTKKYSEIYNLVQENKDKIFCQNLPAPTKTAFVLETSHGSRYFDNSLYPAIDAIILASELGKMDNDPIVKIELKVVKIISKLAEFFTNYSSKMLKSKKGIYRKHYFAGRLHFSARQVITSQHEPHQADELVIPWAGAIRLFMEHLRSKMLKPPYNMSINSITDTLNRAIFEYDPLIDKLLEEIIKDDCPYKGFPCLFSRPPILTRGSIQFFYITKVLKDPSVNTIRFSPLVLVMPNADFDGDALQLTLLVDMGMHDAFLKMHPSYTILDMSNPNRLSDAIKMPAPVIGTVNNWFSESDLKLSVIKSQLNLD